MLKKCQNLKPIPKTFLIYLYLKLSPMYYVHMLLQINIPPYTFCNKLLCIICIELRINDHQVGSVKQCGAQVSS